MIPSIGDYFGRDDEKFEELRTRFFNARVPTVLPAAIACPSTTANVIAAVERAKELGQPIGVRAGGHLFPCCSLLEGGLLIDVKHLNSSIDYDSVTKVISFGPGSVSSSQRRAPKLVAFSRSDTRRPLLLVASYFVEVRAGFVVAGV